MFNFLDDENLRVRYWWPALILLAVFTYLYSLSSLHIPNIGDESPYFQITRLTAESGHWLPLKAAEGLGNTKPPMLFWQGIITTGWGKNWGVLQLRLPIVFYTFLTAFLVFSLAKHSNGRIEVGYIAALCFLGFSSTFQHGRPFLTNMPETFFMFLVFYLLLRFRHLQFSFRFWLLAGVFIGIASLYRSFAVIAPITLALGWYLWWQRKWNLSEVIKRDSWKPALVLVVALACFALWPLLDPEPGLIFQNFFLKENVNKFGGENYLTGLFSGPYSLFRIWFGAMTNAGLLVMPIIYLAIVSFKQRKKLTNDEKVLWILVFSYLIVFSAPTQRQENYILPVMPALAVLLAMQWDRINHNWFYLFNVPMIAALSLFALLMYVIATGESTAGYYSFWHPLVFAAGLTLIVFSFIKPQYAKQLFFAITFLSYLGFGALLAPFDGPLGDFPKSALSSMKNKTIFVSSNFPSKYERHRFVIPGATIKGYRRGDKGEVKILLDRGEFVAIRQRMTTKISKKYTNHGSRLVLRSRLNNKELKLILLQQRTDVLIEREIIVQLNSGS